MKKRPVSKSVDIGVRKGKYSSEKITVALNRTPYLRLGICLARTATAANCSEVGHNVTDSFDPITSCFLLSISCKSKHIQSCVIHLKPQMG